MMFWLVLAFAFSLLSVGVLRRVLLSMQMLDLPGQRRLHQQPIPRGGGLAMGGVAFVLMLIASQLARSQDLIWLLAGFLVVAVIGWWDDRRGLGIAIRLLAHAAAGVMVWMLLRSLGMVIDLPIDVWLAVPLLVLTVVASINLHNFIDGANGMLAVQSALVLAVLVWVNADADPALTTAALIALGSVLGFLPWNFPQARIFMGDIGSGVLGYLLAALTLWAMAGGSLSLPEALVLHSLVLIDGLCTLLFRMQAGRRWWRGHREHLYQWLVRSGRSHAQMVRLIQLWNLLLVLPCLWWMRSWRLASNEPSATSMGQSSSLMPWWIVLAIFTVGVVVWWQAKRGLLRAHRAK